MAKVSRVSDKKASVKKLSAKPGCHLYEKHYKDEFGRKKRVWAYLTPKEAKRVEIELNYFEIQMENNLIQSLREEKQFSEIVIIYIDNKRQRDWNSDRSVQVFQNTIKWLYKYSPITKDTPLGKVKFQWLEGFIYIKLKKGNKKVTVNQNIRDLKTFFNWLVDNRYLYNNPMQHIKLLRIPKNQRSKPPMVLEDFKRLLSMIHNSNDIFAEDFLIFVASTGRRVSELLPPQFTWHNYNENEVVFYPLKRGQDEIRISFLGDDNHPLKKILIRRKKEGLSAPFPYTRHQVYKRIVNRYFPKACLKGYSFMSIRKMVATEIENVYDASSLLGHTTTRTTETFYKRPKMERLSKIVNEFAIDLIV